MAGERIRTLKLDGRPVEVRSVYLDPHPVGWRDGWRITGETSAALADLTGRRAVVAKLEDGSTFIAVGLVRTSVMAAAGITTTILEIHPNRRRRTRSRP
jgi:hypothetical protein